jgi:Uma2 family endonuclease
MPKLQFARETFGQRDIDRPYLLKLYGFTEADFDRMAPESAYCELLDGAIIMPSPVGTGHQFVILFLMRLLDAFCKNSNAGRVLFGPAVMHLAKDRMFEPDVMVIRAEHADRILPKKVAGPADLVIEVLSDSTRRYDLTEKEDAYREGGVPEAWFIDVDNRCITVDRLSAPRVEVTTGRLDSAALSGFWLDSAWLWASDLPDPQQCLEQVLRG